MKRVWSLVLAFALVFSLSACGDDAGKKDDAAKGDDKQQEQENKDGEDNKQEEKDSKEENDEESTDDGVIEVGLVTDTGGIDDRSFNQSTWEGIQRFYTDKGFDIEKATYLQSTADADYIPNLSTFADQKKDLIVAPGFLFGNAISEVATNFPEQKMLLIDAVIAEPKDNVVCAVFGQNEGSFLVGVATALKAQEAGKTKVGFIGGGDFDVIWDFEAGFEQGVHAVDPNMEVLIEYPNTFVDSGLVQTTAAKMYNQGCYIIYHAAGGAGAGLFKEAIDRVKNGEDVWACGVDKDQYNDGIYDEENNKSVILTSMLKRVDVAAYDVCQSVLDGTFEGGKVLVFNLANDGVGLPAENPNLKEEWITVINDYANKIISGEIEVGRTPSRKAEETEE